MMPVCSANSCKNTPATSSLVETRLALLSSCQIGKENAMICSLQSFPQLISMMSRYLTVPESTAISAALGEVVCPAATSSAFFPTRCCLHLPLILFSSLQIVVCISKKLVVFLEDKAEISLPCVR